MSLRTGHHALWATPLGLHAHPAAAELNALLVRVFGAMREMQLARDGLAPAAFFASDDDLVPRIRLPEWQGFVRFLVESLRDTVKSANEGFWPNNGLDLQVKFEGLWFQTSNAGAFHDVHTHGNCSWSGVYVVQVDEPAQREAHPVFGAVNGVTRFYGPAFAQLAGAHVDAGNAYLQPPHVDVVPVPGQLVVFPSWLPHRAMPYAGAAERIVVSFNASVHDATGSNRRHGYAPV
jgi:uncharacterized protein (TIGR02466 family)